MPLAAGQEPDISVAVERVLREVLPEELSMDFIAALYAGYNRLRDLFPAYFGPLGNEKDGRKEALDKDDVARRFARKLADALKAKTRGARCQRTVDNAIRATGIHRVEGVALELDDEGKRLPFDCAGWAELFADKLKEGLDVAIKAHRNGAIFPKGGAPADGAAEGRPFDFHGFAPRDHDRKRQLDERQSGGDAKRRRKGNNRDREKRRKPNQDDKKRNRKRGEREQKPEAAYERPPGPQPGAMRSRSRSPAPKASNPFPPPPRKEYPVCATCGKMHKGECWHLKDKGKEDEEKNH